MTEVNAEHLEDVIKNLTTGKYSKKEIVNALAWGECNKEVFFPLMKKHQPKYYADGWENPVQSFTLIKDLDLNY